MKAAAGILLAIVLAAGLAGPGTSIPATAVTSPTTTTPPPPGSVGPLPTGSPPPSTIPLTSRGQSSHVSPIFAILSGVGAAVVVLVLGTQWLLTRPGRRRHWTL